MTALSRGYTWPSAREVRPSTSTRMWLSSDTCRRPLVDGAECPLLVKVQGPA
jgi:hypothetical protein